jgi:hypothetical protein
MWCKDTCPLAKQGAKSKSFYGKNSGIKQVQVIQKNYVEFMD